jgi:hypothetical protein
MRLPLAIVLGLLAIVAGALPAVPAAAPATAVMVGRQRGPRTGKTGRVSNRRSTVPPLGTQERQNNQGPVL